MRTHDPIGYIDPRTNAFGSINVPVPIPLLMPQLPQPPPASFFNPNVSGGAAMMGMNPAQGFNQNNPMMNANNQNRGPGGKRMQNAAGNNNNRRGGGAGGFNNQQQQRGQRVSNQQPSQSSQMSGNSQSTQQFYKNNAGFQTQNSQVGFFSLLTPFNVLNSNIELFSS